MLFSAQSFLQHSNRLTAEWIQGFGLIFPTPWVASYALRWHTFCVGFPVLLWLASKADVTDVHLESLLCSSGWCRTHSHLPVPVSGELGLHVCTIMPGYSCLCAWHKLLFVRSLMSPYPDPSHPLYCTTFTSHYSRRPGLPEGLLVSTWSWSLFAYNSYRLLKT